MQAWIFNFSFVKLYLLLNTEDFGIKPWRFNSKQRFRLARAQWRSYNFANKQTNKHPKNSFALFSHQREYGRCGLIPAKSTHFSKGHTSSCANQERLAERRRSRLAYSRSCRSVGWIHPRYQAFSRHERLRPLSRPVGIEALFQPTRMILSACIFPALSVPPPTHTQKKTRWLISFGMS